MSIFILIIAYNVFSLNSILYLSKLLIKRYLKIVTFIIVPTLPFLYTFPNVFRFVQFDQKLLKKASYAVGKYRYRAGSWRVCGTQAR